MQYPNAKRILCLVLSALMLLGIFPIGIYANNTDTSTERSTTALKSDIQNMNLSGYVGENLIGNVKNWQIEAYHNNRGIIEQILFANSDTVSLDHVLGTDYFGVDSYYTIDIVQAEKGNALSWTLKNRPGSFSDRDMKFANDPSAITDWSGATDLTLWVDASDVPSSVSVRIAFEENTVGRESYELKKGATVYLRTQNTESAVKVADKGYISLPVGFNGTIRLPLNTDTFSRYWQEGSNFKLDLGKVVQFQLSVSSDSKLVGKSVIMDDFSILGSFGEKTVWNFDNLQKRGVGGNVGNGNIQKWYGEFVGKLLTGMAYSYKATAEEALKTAADKIIDELAKAQGEDGYLGVFVGNDRYAISANNWDLWNQYHCISGLLEWYKLTENKKSLEVAKKALDCIYNVFKDRSYIVAGGFETNRGIAHGYAQMYQITNDKKYLNEAIRIIEEDCKKNAGGWYPMALNGKDFVNSNCLRWEVLHMIMTLGILYEETGNTEYYDVMASVWESILKTDIHNAGTFTTNEGACGNPYEEGIVETCCTIAWAAFTNEYYKYNRSVRVADELERSYFNGILGSLMEDDKYCTYNTPMNGIEGSASFHGGGYDGRRVSSQKDISFQYNTASPDMNCCQANYARGIGQITEWAVMGEKNTLYVNYYGPSSIKTLVDGNPITLTQTTEYPLNGKIKLTVSGLEKDTSFTLKLRIPTWAYGSKITFDGKTVMAKNGEYFEINRTWKNGDEILLDIAVSFTYWAGQKEQTGLTSVFYGPILLTLDSHYAANCTQNTLFTRENIEAAEIRSNSDAWLVAYVKVGQNVVRLVDFASAGKYNGQNEPSTYYTWLKVEGAPKAKKDVTWQNTDKYKIAFGENIQFESALAYKGDTVTFTVAIPQGKAIDTLSAYGLPITEQDGVFSFTMPPSDISVSVTFKDAEATPKPPQEESENTPNEKPSHTEPETEIQKPTKDSVSFATIAAIIGGAVAACALILGFILRRKRKEST